MLANITFSDAAVKHILAKVAAKDEPIVFRIDIKQTGCSGYMYQLNLVPEAKADDIKLEQVTAFNAYISPQALAVMNGTRIDYVTKSLGMKQLVFDNPNVEGLCGCGESFKLKTQE